MVSWKFLILKKIRKGLGEFLDKSFMFRMWWWLLFMQSFLLVICTCRVACIYIIVKWYENMLPLYHSYLWSLRIRIDSLRHLQEHRAQGLIWKGSGVDEKLLQVADLKKPCSSTGWSVIQMSFVLFFFIDPGVGAPIIPWKQEWCIKELDSSLKMQKYISILNERRLT